MCRCRVEKARASERGSQQSEESMNHRKQEGFQEHQRGGLAYSSNCFCASCREFTTICLTRKGNAAAIFLPRELRKETVIWRRAVLSSVVKFRITVSLEFFRVRHTRFFDGKTCSKPIRNAFKSVSKKKLRLRRNNFSQLIFCVQKIFPYARSKIFALIYYTDRLYVVVCCHTTTYSTSTQHIHTTTYHNIQQRTTRC